MGNTHHGNLKYRARTDSSAFRGFSLFHIPAMFEGQDNALPGISINDDMLEDPIPAPLAFCFEAHVSAPIKHSPKANAKHRAHLMMDSGATTKFASEKWVLRHGYKIRPSHTNWCVQVANSDYVNVNGTVDLEFSIQGYSTVERFLVIPMADDMDLILGNDWLRKHKTVLDYDRTTCAVRQDGKRHVLVPDRTTHTVKRQQLPPGSKPTDKDAQIANVEILSYANAKRVIRERDDWMVVQLHHVAGSEDWNEMQFMAAKASVVSPEQQEADIRAAIQRLKAEIQRNQATPTPI
jgi:hypothetical protein